MSAQSEFLRGMRGFRLARDHQDLTEKSPSEVDHNLRSKALRNGIAIIGFSVLEHFIRRRTGELLLLFDKIRIPFQELPLGIKKIATRGAVTGVSARIRHETDAIDFIQTEASVIASSLNTTYQISKYSIGWESSNLRNSDINQIFNSFLIKDGWQAIDELSTRLNLSILSSRDAFNTAAQRRNDAAHNIEAIVHPTHLESFVREAYVIAIGFDLLISSAFQKIYIQDKDYLIHQRQINSKNIIIRTISWDRNKWKEFGDGRKKATKTADSQEELWPDALIRAKRNNEILTCMDREGFPSEWVFPLLP